MNIHILTVRITPLPEVFSELQRGLNQCQAEREQHKVAKEGKDGNTKSLIARHM